MKREKVLLSFIAVLFGILATAIAFYLYQATRVSTNKSEEKVIAIVSPTPTPKPSVFLNIASPVNESVLNKKVVTVSGNTADNATIIVLTPIDQQIAQPAPNGNFSTTVNIDDGENIIEITAISPNGEDVKVRRIVTFSTEEF